MAAKNPSTFSFRKGANAAFNLEGRYSDASSFSFSVIRCAGPQRSIAKASEKAPSRDVSPAICPQSGGPQPRDLRNLKPFAQGSGLAVGERRWAVERVLD